MLGGGPLGAVLGAALGHNFDRGMDGMTGAGHASVEKIQSAFFTATFSVMGHVAKADGLVSRMEIHVAEDLMRQMSLNPEQVRLAKKLFMEGKKANFPLNDVLHQFRMECHRRRSLIQMFMEIQVFTAFSDGNLNQEEHRILKHIAEVLGFSENAFDAILNRIRAQSHMQSMQQGMHLDDAYKLLGVSADASDDEVKRAYRRQMNQHHPDKLVSKGLPQEMMDIATRKTQDIKNAYERIREARKK